ncbi:acyclic terpene utilization AtuA family protein [Comamonas sp. J-3]|uniref:acyclic terpene utilization AtuA family protein n=1 Tax=Comamonas trifloxystrobinivorans TaxID=3350256 RepID=UPI003729C11A
MTRANNETRPLLIGCAAGFSGDRIDAAGPVVQELVQQGKPAVLIFETLAERTLALAQLARRQNPEAGYEPLMLEFLRPVLADCLQHHIRIVSNFGAANPQGAARAIAALAKELGTRAPKIAVVHGDDLSAPAHYPLLETALGTDMPKQPLVSANAYIGARPIADALQAGADIVVCGRVSDPSLVVGPAMAHFAWAWDDWNRLAKATMTGHLLECGTQVTGGYFADPGYKEVPDMERLGYPIAEIESDGNCTIFKPANTGGCINAATVKEQLLYEIHDPASYLTPDVIADISQAKVIPVGENRVRLEGVIGHPRPETLKVNVCFESGWFAEGEISYAGPRAAERARLAAQTIAKRLAGIAPIRTDLIGVTSVWGNDSSDWLANKNLANASQDVRLRMAWQHAEHATAARLPREINALYCCGPAGGGGVRTHMRQRLGMVSCLVPQHQITTGFRWAQPHQE